MFKQIKFLILTVLFLTSCQKKPIPSAYSAPILCDDTPKTVENDTVLPVDIAFGDGRMSYQGPPDPIQSPYFDGYHFRSHDGTKIHKLFSFSPANNDFILDHVSPDKKWVLLSILPSHLREQHIDYPYDFWLIPWDGKSSFDSLDKNSGEKISGLPERSSVVRWLSKKVLLFRTSSKKWGDYSEDMLITLNTETGERKKYSFPYHKYETYKVSPQGTHVAYFDHLHVPTKLTILNLENKKTVYIDVSSVPDPISSFSWSPDGTHLVVEMAKYVDETKEETNYGVYITDLEGNIVQIAGFNATPEEENVFYSIRNLEWSLDGGKIAIRTSIYTSDDTLPYTPYENYIYIYDFEDKSLVRLCYAASPTGGVLWSSKGNYILGVRSPYETLNNDWVLVDVNSGEAWEFPHTNLLSVRYLWEVE